MFHLFQTQVDQNVNRDEKKQSFLILVKAFLINYDVIKSKEIINKMKI